MKYLSILLFSFLFFLNTAEARRYQRPRIDLKLPTQVISEKQEWTDVLATQESVIVQTIDGPSSASAVTVSSGIGTLDYPRNLTVTSNGTTADVAACVITITGTDYNNDTITEDFTFSANEAATKTGTYAFRTVTSIAFPASCEDSPFGATWSVGSGEKLGISRCMATAADWSIASSGGVKEGTAPTVVADTDEIEKNTIDFNTAYDGSADFKFYFFQSFGCD